MSNCNQVNPAPEHQPEESHKHDPVDDALKSTYLWTALRRLHEDLNSKTRYGSQTNLAPETIHLANMVLHELHDFVGDFRNARRLPQFDEADPPTYLNALMVIGQYKAMLRAYMVEMLGKNPYTLG